jgi:hypothetical protein
VPSTELAAARPAAIEPRPRASWRSALTAAGSAWLSLTAWRRDTRARRAPAYRPELGVFLFRGRTESVGRQIVEAFPPREGARRLRAYREGLDAAARRRLEDDVDRAESLLGAHFPFLLRLLRGGADVVAGCGFRELVVLNFSPLMVDWRRFWSCSAVGYRSSGGAVVGQNMDLGRFADFCVAAVVPDDGPHFLAHLNRGTFWFGAGVNEPGLCVAGSSVNVASDAPRSVDRLPHPLLHAWLLTGAESVAHARRRLEEGPGFGPPKEGTNLLLADASGRVESVELCGREVVESDPGRPVRMTTNHFRSSALAPHNRNADAESRAFEQNSRQRHEHACDWAREEPSPLRVRELLRAAGGPGAWRRRATPPDAGYTSASYLFDLGRRRVGWCTGSRGAEGFRELALDDVFGRPA